MVRNMTGIVCRVYRRAWESEFSKYIGSVMLKQCAFFDPVSRLIRSACCGLAFLFVVVWNGLLSGRWASARRKSASRYPEFISVLHEQYSTKQSHACLGGIGHHYGQYHSRIFPRCVVDKSAKGKNSSGLFGDDQGVVVPGYR